MKELKRNVCKGLEKYFTGTYRDEKMVVWKTEVIQKVPVYEYMGDKMTIREFQDKYNTNYYNVINRMKSGKPLNISHGKLKMVEYKGEQITLVDLAKKLSTNIEHLRYNLKRGYEIDKAHKTYSLKNEKGEFKDYRLVDIVKAFCKKHHCKNTPGIKVMIKTRIDSKKYEGNDSLERLIVKKAVMLNPGYQPKNKFHKKVASV